MITEAIAKTLDSTGNGIGAAFAHFKIGSKLKLMSERLVKAEKKIDELEKKLEKKPEKVEKAEKAEKDGAQ